MGLPVRGTPGIPITCRHLIGLPSCAHLFIDLCSSLFSDVVFDEFLTNPELLDLCRRNAPPEKKYVVEDIFREHGRGISVLRLPPYHPELNPIELVWGNIKVNITSIIYIS